MPNRACGLRRLWPRGMRADNLFGRPRRVHLTRGLYLRRRRNDWLVGGA